MYDLIKNHLISEDLGSHICEMQALLRHSPEDLFGLHFFALLDIYYFTFLILFPVGNCHMLTLYELT